MLHCAVVHSFVIRSIWFRRVGLCMHMLVCQWKGRLNRQSLPCCAKDVEIYSGFWSVPHHGLMVLDGISDSSTFNLIQPSRLLSGSHHLGEVLFVRSLCTVVGWWFLGIECTCFHHFMRSGCRTCKIRHDWCVGPSVSTRGVFKWMGSDLRWWWVCLPRACLMNLLKVVQKWSGGHGVIVRVSKEESDCHLPLSLMLGMCFPLAWVRFDVVMTSRYEWLMLHLIMTARVIPWRRDITFIMDWLFVLWVCGVHWSTGVLSTVVHYYLQDGVGCVWAILVKCMWCWFLCPRELVCTILTPTA